MICSILQNITNIHTPCIDRDGRSCSLPCREGNRNPETTWKEAVLFDQSDWRPIYPAISTNDILGNQNRREFTCNHNAEHFVFVTDDSSFLDQSTRVNTTNSWQSSRTTYLRTSKAIAFPSQGFSQAFAEQTGRCFPWCAHRKISGLAGCWPSVRLVGLTDGPCFVGERFSQNS